MKRLSLPCLVALALAVSLYPATPSYANQAVPDKLSELSVGGTEELSVPLAYRAVGPVANSTTMVFDGSSITFQATTAGIHWRLSLNRAGEYTVAGEMELVPGGIIDTFFGTGNTMKQAAGTVTFGGTGLQRGVSYNVYVMLVAQIKGDSGYYYMPKTMSSTFRVA